MQESKVNQKLEIKLNMFMELVEPRIPNLLDYVDNVDEVDVYVMNGDYTDDRILKINSYGDHVKVWEFYKSRIGEVTIERVIHNKKPSEVLKVLFPDTFK